jgi:hypothetical protein
MRMKTTTTTTSATARSKRFDDSHVDLVECVRGNQSRRSLIYIACTWVAILVGGFSWRYNQHHHQPQQGGDRQRQVVYFPLVAIMLDILYQTHKKRNYKYSLESLTLYLEISDVEKRGNKSSPVRSERGDHSRVRIGPSLDYWRRRRSQIMKKRSDRFHKVSYPG